MGASFEDWWAIYPRRVAKKDAEKAWRVMTEAQKFSALESLPTHVRYWQLAGKEKEFLPYPATWLRGERWEDELEMPVAKKIEDAWWASNEGIQRKAREVGIIARGGESYQDLKARILAKTRAA